MTLANRRRAEGVIVLAVGYLLVRAFWLASSAAGAGRAFDSATFEAIAKIGLWGGACLPIAAWLAGRNGISVPAALGLGPGWARGLRFGLVSTLPMFAALFLIPRQSFDLDLAFGSGVLGPFAEELLFRGFLFGLLWRVAGWSLPASIIVSSLMFGFAHETAVVPLAAGGAVLAWIAYRWNSLWPAVAMHGCMNFWWDLTRGEHARPTLGPDLMSAAQLLSVAAAILITLRFGAAGTTGTPGKSGATNDLTLANDLQLKIVDKSQVPGT